MVAQGQGELRTPKEFLFLPWGLGWGSGLPPPLQTAQVHLSSTTPWALQSTHAPSSLRLAVKTIQLGAYQLLYFIKFILLGLSIMFYSTHGPASSHIYVRFGPRKKWIRHSCSKPFVPGQATDIKKEKERKICFLWSSFCVLYTVRFPLKSVKLHF